MEDLADRQYLAAPIMMWLIAACVAVVSTLVGVLSYSKFSIVLAASVLALLPAMTWRGTRGSMRGVAAFFSVMLTMLLAGEMALSDVGLILITILCTTPLGILASRWIARSAKPWKRASLRIAIALIPGVTAVTMAAVRFHHNEQQTDESGYTY
jgi:hypothetical protein